jgi:hypothetical protein
VVFNFLRNLTGNISQETNDKSCLVHIIGSGGSLIASFMHIAVQGRLCNLAKL